MTIISLPLIPQKKKKRKEKRALTRLGMNMRVQGGVLWYLAPDFGSRSFGSCGFQGVVSFEWACSGASHRW